MEKWKEEQKWLNSLKVGDEVAISTRFSGYEIQKVAKLTKTQIIIRVKHATNTNYYDLRFRKSDGGRVSSMVWFTKHLEKPTDAVRKEIARKKLLKQIEAGIEDVKADTRLVSTEDLQKLKDAIQKCVASTKKKQNRRGKWTQEHACTAEKTQI